MWFNNTLSLCPIHLLLRQKSANPNIVVIGSPTPCSAVPQVPKLLPETREPDTEEAVDASFIRFNLAEGKNTFKCLYLKSIIIL
jgi:hypothetical protein